MEKPWKSHGNPTTSPKKHQTNVQSITNLLAMQYCWLPQERREPVFREKPPVVISNNRFQRIRAHAYQTAKQEQLHQLQLRNEADEKIRIGGEELLKKFAGRNLCISREEECARELKQMQEQHLEAKRLAEEETKASRLEHQKTRTKRIEAAQKLLEQLRPGPRELQCARLQSEVMRSVNVQREVQAEFAKANQRQKELDRKIFQEQVLRGFEEAQQRHKEQCQQLGQHKRELLQLIAERERERQATKAKELQEALQERERNQRMLKDQQDKEKQQQATKQRQKRDEALASLVMSEQRQKRLQMLEEVEQVQCDIHNEAKGYLEKLKRDRAKERVEQRIRRNEKLAKELAPRLHYSAREDEERHKRQVDEMRKVHSAEQAKRRESKEKAKNARLAIQKEEEELSRKIRQRAEEKRKKAVMLRLQNDLTNVQFKQQQRQEHLQRIRDLRRDLDEQVKKRIEEETRPGTNYNREAQLEELREDAFFFDYARQLMDEANAKGCPLKPFIRAVGQYKNDNGIGAEIRVPRHMVTRLPMGRRTQGDSKMEGKEKSLAEQEPNADELSKEEKLQRQRIEENLKKIEELVLQEAKAKKDLKSSKKD
ncbi:trichohyalin [Drosophila eugracilis]|uniref:trichohyalin n=1 Tax=Drosophila eugracilis TaxID=29029 RepID=UPI0007E824AD|nr:trichohyalin [Drosophila eugracilis]